MVMENGMKPGLSAKLTTTSRPAAGGADGRGREGGGVYAAMIGKAGYTEISGGMR